MPQHPLGEVFGFPAENLSEQAQRYRNKKLCPFHNKVPNCTKDKAKDPLGVCSINYFANRIITCPIRFRQDWIIVEHAANFFFPKDANWTSLAEVRLNDRNGISAGNIDFALVSYDEQGRITDFGSLEVQAVYISGNLRNPFAEFMKNPQRDFNWPGGYNYPTPDFLSSSRKRLVPQMLYKGGIFHSWGKKQAVALQQKFYETLPKMNQVAPENAEIAWFLYDLADGENELWNLELKEVIYTDFNNTLTRISTPEPGPMEKFIGILQSKLDSHLESNTLTHPR